MKKMLAVFFGATLALGVANLAHAEDEEEVPVPTGLNLSVGGLFAFEDFDSGLDADGTWGVGLRAGYRSNRYFELALEADYYHEFDITGGDVTGWSVMPVVRVYPWVGRIEPYAKLGLGLFQIQDFDAGFSDGDDKALELGVKVGGGVDVNVSDNLAVFLDASYLLGDAELDDFSAIPVTIGVKYRLGASES